MHNLFSRYDSFSETADVRSLLKWGNPDAHPYPEVSIIIPAYKRPDLFRQALQSAIEQDFSGDYEIIVVDNNVESVSPNQAVVEHCGSDRVLYYRNEKNIGMSGNWNRGIELSRASFVTFCHDDDLLAPGSLSRLMQLQKNTGEKAILTPYTFIDKEGKPLYSMTSLPSRLFGLLKHRDHYTYSSLGQWLANVSCGGGCLYFRQHMLALGGYDQSFYPIADYALNVKYAQTYGAIVNEIPTYYYRTAENESMNVWKDMCEKSDQMIRMIPRHRLIPRFIAKMFAEARRECNLYDFANMWSGETSACPPKAKHARLIALAKKIDAVHKYSLHIRG